MPSSSNTLVVGDSIKLWSGVTKFVGSPIIENNDGIEWDDSRISEGLLFVKSIATGITQHSSLTTQHFNVYDLRGRMVRQGATSTEGLKPGIYVIEGRKCVVR
jgi:hypothetical protein